MTEIFEGSIIRWVGWGGWARWVGGGGGWGRRCGWVGAVGGGGGVGGWVASRVPGDRNLRGLRHQVGLLACLHAHLFECLLPASQTLIACQPDGSLFHTLFQLAGFCWRGGLGCRATRRLDELMQQLENAAKVAGDTALAGEALVLGCSSSCCPCLLPRPGSLGSAHCRLPLACPPDCCADKFAASRETIRRDLMFAASLYV